MKLRKNPPPKLLTLQPGIPPTTPGAHEATHSNSPGKALAAVEPESRKEYVVVYGRTSFKVFALYDLRSSSWRTWPRSEAEGSIAYSGTWPHSGMTRTGRAYERVTLVQPIGESGFLSSPTSQKQQAYSLLPTPVASDGSGGQPIAKRRAGGHQVDLSDLVISLWALPSNISSQADHERAAAEILPGADTEPLSTSGKQSPDGLHRILSNEAREDNQDSRPSSASG